MNPETLKESEENSIPDTALLFEAQRKKYRGIALFLLILMGLSFLSVPVLFFLDASETLLTYAFYLMFFSVVVSALPVWLMNKCPACGKYQGRTAPETCCVCGAVLQKKKEDSH